MQTKLIPEFTIKLTPLSEEAKLMNSFDDNCYEKLGRRFKIGGEPDFIQNDDWPICNYCKEKMSFYAQLDTVGQSIYIADAGLIYVFYCFDCNETKSIIQSY